MRGTECEEVKNSRELRNIFRANLATGQDSRLPIISEGEREILQENPSTRANLHHQYVGYPHCITTNYIGLHSSSKYFILMPLLKNTTYYIPPKKPFGGPYPPKGFGGRNVIGNILMY
jgi:hypothetical protein